MKLSVMLLSLLLVSCAFKKEEVNKNAGVWPKELEVYLQTFIQEGNARGIHSPISNLSMEFGNFPGNVIGSCLRNSSGSIRQVTISSNFWNVAGVEAREQLIYHELGHCLLFKDHNDTLVRYENSGASAKGSLMSTYHLDAYLYAANRDFYLEELFRNVLPSFLRAIGNVFPYLVYQPTTPTPPIAARSSEDDQVVRAFAKASVNSDEPLIEYVTYGEEVNGDLHIGCDHK